MGGEVRTDAPSVARLCTVGAWAMIVLGFVLRVIYPDTIYFNIHTERDVWRTIQILQGDRFPYLGSELTMGGYTPGPALYLLQMPPLLLTFDPRALLVWVALLHAGALWLTWRMGVEHFSHRVGLAAVALFATWPLGSLAVRYLWNPSYLFPMTALFFWGLLDWIFRRRWQRVPVVVGVLAVMIQVHISALMLLTLMGVCAAIWRPPLPRRAAIAGAAVFLVAFMPYIVGELATGFENSRKFGDPPATLRTANGAVIPLPQKERLMVNVGALKALQVALSPVIYDRRYVTGSFSYLALLAEFGPDRISPLSWRLVYLLHQMRWAFVAAFAGFLGWAAWALITNRDRGFFGREPRPADGAQPEAPSPRSWGLFFLLAIGFTIVPPLFAATMVAPLDGGKVGVGAIRYYFVAFPIPLLMLALVLRAAGRAAACVLPLRAAQVAAASLVGVVCVVQTHAQLAFHVVANDMDRSFKYSLHEAFNWRVQRRAADHLVREWGITPEQFRHHFHTLDHTFDSTNYQVPSLEMGLDYAYFTHPDLDPAAPPRHPGAHVYIHDIRRSPEVDLTGLDVFDRHDAGGLILLLARNGEWREHSPIQNTWELLDRPRRLQR